MKLFAALFALALLAGCTNPDVRPLVTLPPGETVSAVDDQHDCVISAHLITGCLFDGTHVMHPTVFAP